jgi:cobalt-zinc-cadmium efflux system protein
MGHHHAPATSTSRDLLIAFALNAGFAVFEVIGGLYINSVAVLSDALHDLGDSISLGLAWALGKKAEQGRDQRYSYGYLRFSLLGALINTIVLIVGSLVILREAIPRLLAPEPFDAVGMIGFALVGITVNGIAALRLRGHGSANAQVVGWHLLEDVLGWGAVLIVGIVSLFVDWPVLDPLLSIGITLYVLYNVIGALRDTLNLFLQAVPADIDLGHVAQQLRGVDGVQDLHHMHLWSLDGEHHVFSTHLVVDEDTSKQAALCIKQDCRRALSDLDLAHVTLEIEYGEQDCSMNSA